MVVGSCEVEGCGMGDGGCGVELMLASRSILVHTPVILMYYYRYRTHSEHILLLLPIALLIYPIAIGDTIVQEPPLRFKILSTLLPSS